MIDVLSTFAPETSGVLAAALGVFSRATVLLVLALVVHLLLVSRRPMVRSALWNSCLIGLVLLPLTAFALPRLRVDCLPELQDSQAVERNTASVNGSGSSVETWTSSRLPIPEPAMVPAEQSPPAPRFDASVAIVAVYVAVVSLLLTRLSMSLAGIMKLIRSSEPINDLAWVGPLDLWRERLKIVRRVRLAHSARVSVPVVVGWRRPMIIVPESLAGALQPRSIDAVLLHELAHIRREDYPWNLLLRLVQAIYWPHPLIWLSGRLVARLREQACDDLCVYWMGGSQEYRATLADLAAGLVRRTEGLLGLAMTRSSRLGRRLAAIERSPGAPRCLPQLSTRAVIGLAAIAAVGLLGSIELTRRASAAPGSQEPTKIPVPEKSTTTQPTAKRKVKVAKLRKSRLIRTTSQIGSAEPAATANVYARVSGTVAKPKYPNIDANLNLVEVGEAVRKGQVLAVIDAPELAADVKENRIQVERAQARCAQSKAVLAAAHFDEAKDERPSRAKVTVAEADLQVADADLRLAQARLARSEAAVQTARIISPIRGVVTQRSVNEGDFVRSAAVAGSASPVFSILRTDVIRMVVHIPDQDVPLLQIGQPAEVRFDALRMIARAKVSRMAVAENLKDRTLRAEIDLPNPDGKIRPGMYGTATITLQEKPGALAIPRAAIVRSGGNGVSQCFRIVNDRAVWTHFRTGESQDPIRHDTEVVDGLKEGEIVIVNPGILRDLKSGEPVESVMEDEEADSQPRS